ncbi:MAG TPA: alkyl hydroperoxide reductase subunit F [Gammaproteobacteria bacterium]|nr:alkyl hydroperoxide reductase subunit F [Gammaproteobacteria bacterium]
MLDANIKAQLKSYLEKLANPIEIVASLDDSAKSREMLGLIEDILELSDKISLRESADAERKPAFAITRPGEEPRVHFAGIPMGHEFTSLVLALLQVGGYPPKVAPEVIEQIRNLDGEYRFETYISLSCQNCPDVVQALNLMAVLNPNISHVMIDGALFQDEVAERQIMSVPTIYLNGEQYGQGRMGVEDFLRQLDTGAVKREAEQISAKEPFDVLVVGAGPAGAAAAIYAARKGIRTGMVAERLGGQLMDTMDIENFISVSKTEGPKLAAQLEAHVKDYDVDIMSGQRAEALIPGQLLEVRLASGAVVRSKAIVLATGARWREINVPGEREYRGRGVGYCPHCDGPLFKGKPIAVIGGGNSGVEAAIDLAGIVEHVTLLEFDSKLRADAVLQKKLHSLDNVRVVTSAQTTEIHGDGSKVNGLTYKDRETGELHRLALDGVFVQIGLLPNTDWLKGTVELTKYGEIVVDERGQTSVPGVFAAGDVTTVPHKQIVIAMGEGAKASISAFDYLIRSSVAEEQPAAASA